MFGFDILVASKCIFVCLERRMTPTQNGGASIRRSGSFETIASNSYLSGEWPRTDPLVTQAYFCPSTLTADKFTQVSVGGVETSTDKEAITVFYGPVLSNG